MAEGTGSVNHSLPAAIKEGAKRGGDGPDCKAKVPGLPPRSL